MKSSVESPEATGRREEFIGNTAEFSCITAESPYHTPPFSRTTGELSAIIAEFSDILAEFTVSLVQTNWPHCLDERRHRRADSLRSHNRSPRAGSLWLHGSRHRSPYTARRQRRLHGPTRDVTVRGSSLLYEETHGAAISARAPLLGYCRRPVELFSTDSVLGVRLTAAAATALATAPHAESRAPRRQRPRRPGVWSASRCNTAGSIGSIAGGRAEDLGRLGRVNDTSGA
jgi:hypothetical protein